MQLDYREDKIMKDFPDAEITTLEVGDIVEGQLCIERKSINDFLASIIDRRLFNQAVNMKANYKYPIILVEGDLRNISETIHFAERKISMEQVRGAIASVYTKYEVPILFCSTRANFKELVFKLIIKSQEAMKDGTDKLLVYTPAINKTKSNPKLQVLLNIPGIGETKAKRILDYYGTFENIKHMKRPPGVSEKDLNSINEVLK